MQNKGLGANAVFIAVIAAIIFLAAQPANVIGVPNTVSSLDINSSSSGDVQVVALASGQSIYVTHYHLFSSGTTTAQWDYGTGSNCGSSTNTIDGPMSFIAQTGISAGTGLGAVFVVPQGNALCLNLGTGSIQVGGTISYQQSP